MDSIQVEEYFQKYYDELMRQIINARAHLKLWERLESYRTGYLKELNQAPHFFTYTIRAHLDDALMTLSRIIRKQEQAVTIWKSLDFVESNRKIFSDRAFRQRIKGNPFHESLTKFHTPITPKEIEKDRKKLLSLERAIDNLNTLRDKVIAHIDQQFLLTGKIISEEYPLQHQQLEEVIDTIVKILNRYSYAYNSSTWLEKIPGEDDVQNVMEFIRFYIQERKKQIEEFRRQARDKN